MIRLQLRALSDLVHGAIRLPLCRYRRCVEIGVFDALLETLAERARSRVLRDTALGEGLPDHTRPNLSWSLRISGVLLLLWLGPVAALLLAFGPDDVFSRIATFFSQMAVVTFGGAYAVLAYVAQEAVET